MPPKLSEWLTPDGSAATPSYFTRLQDEVIQWWLQHQRGDLPWRPPSHRRPSSPPFFNPYAIWVSEVMSQQTLMGTVISYFSRWMAKFPTIEILARASENDVRAVWAGMGYYRRAMYLLKGAQYLVELHKKEKRTGPVTMPSTAVELLKVPGVGPYTAGAIASVCFGEAVIATDGNVVRVLSRLRGEPSFDPKVGANIKLAGLWGQTVMDGGLDKEPKRRTAPNPGGLNQGLMELGSSVCRPNGEPFCDQCPVRDMCRAWTLRRDGAISCVDGVIPLRGSRSAKRQETVVCVVHEIVKADAGAQERGRFVVVRRPTSGLLGGMLEFPSLPITVATEVTDVDSGSDTSVGAVTEEADIAVRRTAEALSCGAALATTHTVRKPSSTPAVPRFRPAGTVSHVFSHIDMTVVVFHARWVDTDSAGEEDIFASSFTGACTQTEDTVCTRVAAALGAADVTTSGPVSPKDTKRVRAAKAKAVAEAPELIERRISIMSEADLRKAAASRLLLKILEATTAKEGAPQRNVKRRRSESQ